MAHCLGLRPALLQRRLLAALMSVALLIGSVSSAVGQVDPEEPEVEEVAEDDGFRLPPPDEAALEAARKVIGEVYRDSYREAKTDDQRIGLANRLLIDAGMTEDDIPGRFMMQRIARDIAVSVHDPETAFKAIDELAGKFALDPQKLKAEALRKMQGTPKLPIHTRDYVENLDKLYNEAVAEDQYDDARTFIEAAETMSRRINDIDLRKLAISRAKYVDSLEKNYAQVAPARAKLDEDPLDAAANEAVGRYLCFIKDNWAGGIPMLALGEDAKLRKLARAEMLLDDKDTSEIVSLGDRWWKLAEAETTANDRTAQRRRAGFWYEQAIPRLTGLSQAKAQQRVDEIARE